MGFLQALADAVDGIETQTAGLPKFPINPDYVDGIGTFLQALATTFEELGERLSQTVAAVKGGHKSWTGESANRWYAEADDGGAHAGAVADLLVRAGTAVRDEAAKLHLLRGEYEHQARIAAQEGLVLGLWHPQQFIAGSAADVDSHARSAVTNAHAAAGKLLEEARTVAGKLDATLTHFAGELDGVGAFAGGDQLGTPDFGNAPEASFLTLLHDTNGLVNGFYDRGAAVRWALDHAGDAQFNGDECTWFVSQALWAGGFPQSTVWTKSGSHGLGHWPGSRTAWLVDDLRQYLGANFSVTEEQPIDPSASVEALPDAQPGDILLYSWDGGNTYSHMAFVVDVPSSQSPTVSEMGNTNFGLNNYLFNAPATYVTRGWNWSAKSSPPDWLQNEMHGDVRVILLHVNGGFFAPSY
ncbi:MAG: hypothetical protein QOJ29_309 [Thermoleophilaceae bacterium]|jgi:uncharacterized protein YukE|nr:hypothetical protein [Thermoleophilaceae bacterium]